MINFIVAIIFIMLLTTMLSFGCLSLFKYMKDNNIESIGWKGLFIIIGFGCLSIVLIPIQVTSLIVEKMKF